jgi:hypothetical protein
MTDRIHFALGAASEFQIGRIALPFYVMHYVYDLSHIRADRLYMRFGVKYTPKHNFFIGINLKGTLDDDTIIRSDYMEMNMGYRFKRKPVERSTY